LKNNIVRAMFAVFCLPFQGIFMLMINQPFSWIYISKMLLT